MHGGGGDRLPWIGLALLDWAPDLIAITEFRSVRGGSLRGVLADHGWKFQAQSTGPRHENTVFVASRTPIVGVDAHTELGGLARRLVTVTLACGTSVSAAHIPDAQRSDSGGMVARTAVWRALLRRARTERAGKHVVLGDLNTGRHRLDEAGSTFSCTALLGELVSMGYVDAWRAVHGASARQASWVSHAGGGFRLDHALVSRPLAGAIRGAEYGRNALKTRLSDHAPLVVELAPTLARTIRDGGADAA